MELVRQLASSIGEFIKSDHLRESVSTSVCVCVPMHVAASVLHCRHACACMHAACQHLSGNPMCPSSATQSNQTLHGKSTRRTAHCPATQFTIQSTSMKFHAPQVPRQRPLFTNLCCLILYCFCRPLYSICAGNLPVQLLWNRVWECDGSVCETQHCSV